MVGFCFRCGLWCYRCMYLLTLLGLPVGSWNKKYDQKDTRISADPGYSGHRGDTPAFESSTNGVVQQQQRELITLCFVSTRPVDAAAAVAHAALLLLHLRFGFRKNLLLPLFRRHTRNCHTTAHTAVVLLPLSPATHTPNLSLTPPI